MKTYVRPMFIGLAIAAMAAPIFAAGDSAEGKTVFEHKCKTCHAASGDGNPGMAKALKVTFTPLGSADVQKKADADLKKIITEGMGKMKPVQGLSDEDKANVIAYVRTLKK